MIRLLCNVLFLLPPLPPQSSLSKDSRKNCDPFYRQVRKPYKEGGGYLVSPCTISHVYFNVHNENPEFSYKVFGKYFTRKYQPR